MARLPRNAQLWKEKAEIDYVGPFVKSWAAFNAWYRHEANTRQDRAGLEFVRNRVNPVRAQILPHLRPQEFDEQRRPIPDDEAALEFKLLVSDLHTCLENYHIEVEREDILERISFRSICLSRGVNLPRSRDYSRHTYTVTKENGQWKSTVLRANQTEKLRIEQAQYDLDELVDHQDFIDNLSVAQRAQLQNLYQECNPRPMKDLVNGRNDPIIAGDVEFRCTNEELFAGVVAVVYAMRNALLHGELQPDEPAFKAYEAAYRIIMRFLECIR